MAALVRLDAHADAAVDASAAAPVAGGGGARAELAAGVAAACERLAAAVAGPNNTGEAADAPAREALERQRVEKLVKVLKAVQMAKRLRVDAEPGHVRGHVYLGSVGAAYNRKRLDALGVTHVLCVASGLQPAHPGAFVYEQVEVLDAPTEDLAAPSARVTPSAGPYGSALRALPRLHRAGQAERRERARALLCRQVALHQRRAGLAAPGPRDAPAGRPRPGAGAARGRAAQFRVPRAARLLRAPAPLRAPQRLAQARLRRRARARALAQGASLRTRAGETRRRRRFLAPAAPP